MDILIKIYSFLAFQATAPVMFGIFHLLFLVLIAILTIFICKKYALASEKTERTIAFSAWLIFLILEFYKQIVESFSLSESTLVFSYNWGYFPFQLCSSPLYVLPFIAFLPSGKLREAFVSFASTVILFAGLAVSIYPGNVFVETLGLNFQTLLWHGSQVWLGAYFLTRRFAQDETPKKKAFFCAAIPIFLAFTAIAILLNVYMQNALNAKGIEHQINMFFISPYYDTIFPVLSNLKPLIPYPIFALLYMLFTIIFSYLIFSAAVYIINRIFKKQSPPLT